MQKPKRVTMLDVAQQAGVSYQTVSRVINNHPSVAPKTRRRILNVIDQLNYRPSKMAQNLASRHSMTLGVVTYGIQHYGPTQMVVNIEHAAQEAGYDLIFTNINPDENSDIPATIDRMTQWSIAGLLLIAPVSSNQYEHLLDQFSHLPLIQIDITPGATVPSVIIDQYAGSYTITRHLLDLGHTRICEIHGPMNWFGAQARHEGFIQAHIDAGIDPIASVEGNWQAKSGYDATQHLLKSVEFTGLVVANDQMALGAMNALVQDGKRIPQDISVVGFDDVPEAAFYLPPLTTIRQNFSELGRQGLWYLLEMIDTSAATGNQRVIPTELVVRESTAVPAGI